MHDHGSFDLWRQVEVFEGHGIVRTADIRGKSIQGRGEFLRGFPGKFGGQEIHRQDHRTGPVKSGGNIPRCRVPGKDRITGIGEFERALNVAADVAAQIPDHLQVGVGAAGEQGS